MTTLERVNALLRASLPFHQDLLPHQAFGNLHRLLDRVDRQRGVITKHGRHNVYGLRHEQPIVQEYVGARIRRLERHLGLDWRIES